MDNELMSSSRVSSAAMRRLRWTARNEAESCVAGVGIVAGVCVGCGEPPPKPRKALSGK